MKRGMKKFATGMYAAALLALLSGCASTPKETITLTPEDINPVAIMEIKVYDDLSAYVYSQNVISGGGLLGALGNAVINAAQNSDSAFHSADIAEYAKKVAYEELPNFYEVTKVIPESTLLSSDAYKALKNKKDKDYIAPSGYKLITDAGSYGDKSLPLVKEQQAIAAETGAKGFAYIRVYVRPEIDSNSKSTIKGKTNGYLHAKVVVDVIVFDVDGNSMAQYESEYPGYWTSGSHYANTWKGKNNKPFSRWTGTAISDDYVKLALDVYDKDEMHELFTPELIRKAFKQAAIRKQD